MRGADGCDVSPVAVEQAKGGGHHREAIVVFAAGADVTRPRIVVKNVGGISERLFAFDGEGGPGTGSTAMMFGVVRSD